MVCFAMKGVVLLSYSETQDTHNDHCQDIRPGDFDPLAERRPLVQSIVMVCWCAVALFLPSFILAHDVAAAIARLIVLVCIVAVCGSLAAIEEAHLLVKGGRDGVSAEEDEGGNRGRCWRRARRIAKKVQLISSRLTFGATRPGSTGDACRHLAVLPRPRSRMWEDLGEAAPKTGIPEAWPTSVHRWKRRDRVAAP